MAHWPEMMRAFVSFSRTVVREPGAVPADQRWLVGHVASHTRGCRYCTAHTLRNAHHAELPEEKLDAVWSYETSPLFDEAERAALRFAQIVAQGAASDGDFAKLRQFYDERQVVEIMAVIALFAFLNCWNDAVATPLEESTLAFAREKGFDAHGWMPGPHETAPPVPDSD